MAAVSEKILGSTHILCDIEGTTTSISFVKDTLFPYALKNVEEYLKNNWNEEATKTVVAALREQAEEDKKAEVEGVTMISAGDSEDIIPEIVKNVEWQMSKDRKTGSLKTLQGLVWAKGYKDGTIKGHVYDDVQKAFEQWTESGRKIYIYSSGSVDAQKLLFEHSEQGNLLKYLAGHYDTKIGAKREKESYESILKNIESSGEKALFLTDVYAEAKAAKEAGLNVVLLDRPGNVELSEEERKEFTVITTFSDLSFEQVPKEENGGVVANGGGKRKIEETTEVSEEDQAQEPPSKVTKVEDEKKAKSIEENGTTDTKGTVDEPPKPSSTDAPAPKPTEEMEVDGGEAPAKSDSQEEKAVEKMEEDSPVEKLEKTEKMDLDKPVDKPVETEKQSTGTSDKTDDTVEKKETEVIEPKEKESEKTEPTEKKDSTPLVKPDEKEVESKAVDENDGDKKADEKDLKTPAEEPKDDAKTKVDEKQTKSVDDKVEKTVVDSSKVADTSLAVEDKKVEEDKTVPKDTPIEKEKDVIKEKGKEEVAGDIPKKSDLPVEDNKEATSTEAKTEDAPVVEDVKSAPTATTDGVETEKTNSDIVSTTTTDTDETGTSKNSKEGEAEAAPKSEAEVNGKESEAKVTTNGDAGSSVAEEEKNGGGDSDKENDTSLNNCEATEEVNGEKTNGTTTTTTATATTTESSTDAEEVTSTEIKAKKVIEPVVTAPVVTPAPPIEAES